MAGSALLSLAWGPAGIPPRRVFSLLLAYLTGRPVSGAESVIILQLRLPRILLGALVGGGLAGAGSSFQAVFHNSLADPYIIGVSAGAGLGAALGMILGPIVPGMSAVPFLAFLGAILTAILVYSLARIAGRISPATLLLAGVAVGSFLTACLSLLLVFFRRNLDEIVFWLMGSLAGRGWSHLWLIAPYILAGLAGLLLLARELNAIVLGEENATHLGVNVPLVRNLVLALGSLLAAACVSTTGIIGFVGLMVPHIARLIAGADHQRLIPVAAVFGAALIVLADTIARAAIPPMEIPVGVITSLAGGPFFLWLLRRKGRFS